MLSGTLLPAHIHPLPEELLSSWLVRLAHAHGLKLQTFCDLVFGKPLQVWNRDIDRYAPLWLLDALADLTATPIERVWQTTVAAYEGVVFPQQNATGVQRWTLCAGMYHRTRLMHWLQVCPACLAAGPVPYYRRPWRLAFMTCCAGHGLRLIDACPKCGAGIAFFRGELGRPRQRDVVSMSLCYACRFDLATSSVEVEHDAGLRWLAEWLTEPVDLAAEMLGVLHQLVRLRVAVLSAVILAVASRVGAAALDACLFDPSKNNRNSPGVNVLESGHLTILGSAHAAPDRDNGRHPSLAINEYVQISSSQKLVEELDLNPQRRRDFLGEHAALDPQKLQRPFDQFRCLGFDKIILRLNDRLPRSLERDHPRPELCLVDQAQLLRPVERSRLADLPMQLELGQGAPVHPTALRPREKLGHHGTRHQ